MNREDWERERSESYHRQLMIGFLLGSLVTLLFFILLTLAEAVIGT